MDLNTAFRVFEQIKDDKLCLLYNGSFSDDITSKFIELSEYNIESSLDLSKIKNRVSYLMAECFQNIVRHGETKNQEESEKNLPGYFSVKNKEKTYFITTGNLISKKNIEKLDSHLKQVNSLTQDELKALYKKVIFTQELSEKGGAGLGLIEMARKSGHKIDYSFREFDSDLSFFYSQIQLTKDDDEVNFRVDEAISFHDLMNSDDILMVQKGDFSQETILPVLKIIEENFQKDKKLRKNRAVYHVLVELLQNISKHSFIIDDKHDGIFLIIKTDTSYIITAGNYIEKSKVNVFKEKLEAVKDLTEDELEELYMKVLIDGEESKDGGAGLGLIDIARESIEPLKYQFKEIDEKKVFFTIIVTI